jgi:hypothetical protein
VSQADRYATERIFLRKVGGGYIFIHRPLQDYFAELWEREYGGADARRPRTRDKETKNA